MTYQIKGLPRREIPALNDGQFQAIADSRAKWQYLAWHDSVDEVPECKACSYSESLDKGWCWGCPIAQYGCFDCRNTPYVKWVYASGEEEKCQAEAEYMFIEGIYSIELHRRMGL